MKYLEKLYKDVPEKVRKLAYPSAEAYTETIDSKSPAPYVNSNLTDYRFMYFENKSILLIEFQESKQFIEWFKTNLRFFPKKRKPKSGSNFKAHGGFLDQFEEVEEIILNEVKQNVNTIKYIVIRGYSLGAALVQLCKRKLSVILEANKEIKIFATAYEPPRVWSLYGNKETKKHVKDVLLVCNGGDVVTHLPFMFMSFRHIGHKIIIGNVIRDILFPFLIGPHFRGSVKEALMKKFGY